MASILSVTPEVIINILKYLNPFEIESVARTLNLHLYYPAVHLLSSRRTWVRNARAMCALFPPSGNRRLLPSYPGHIPVLGECQTGGDEIPRNRYKAFRLDPSRGPYFRSSPPELQSWLKLDGSFDWLEPLEKEMASEAVRNYGLKGGPPIAPKSQVDSLVAKVAKLGLTLPTGFETFFRSRRLYFRIPSGNAWYFLLGMLVRCPPSLDDGAGGYILRFHCDQQWCAFAYLYLNPSGHHCVLYSILDLYAEMGMVDSDTEDSYEDGESSESDTKENEAGDDEIEDDEDEDDADEDEYDNDEPLPQISKKKVQLVGLTFEEYLAMVYFEWHMESGSTPFKGLRDYVQNTYQSPLKIQHMRKSCSAVNSFLRAIRWRSKAQYKKSASPDLWP